MAKEKIENNRLHLENGWGNAPATCCLVMNGPGFSYQPILGQQVNAGFRLGQPPRKRPTML